MQIEDNMEVKLSCQDFENIIGICSKSELVRNEVIKNHDDNLWWPKSVLDWKKRMLISGFSSQVLRRQLELLTQKINLENIITKNNYYILDLPDNKKNLTWFVHLILIYYKRKYCNKKNPERCLINNSVQINCKRSCILK